MIKRYQKDRLYRATYGLEETHPNNSMRLFIEKICQRVKTVKNPIYTIIGLFLTGIVIYPKISIAIIFTLLSCLYISTSFSRMK